MNFINQTSIKNDVFLFIFMKKLNIFLNMDRFNNIRVVNSPLSNTNSPNYTYETHRSIVINKSSTDIQPTKLDFRSNLDSKFSNANMITSQVFSNSGRNPMGESTVNYMRNIYRGIPGLTEDRLRQIS